MPFLHFSTSLKLSKEVKTELSKDIMKCVGIMPGKPMEKTMIRIDDGCDIFRNGEIAECCYMQTTFSKTVAVEDQTAYIEALYKVMKDRLGLDWPQCYFSMVELDRWGSRGTLHTT